MKLQKFLVFSFKEGQTPDPNNLPITLPKTNEFKKLLVAHDGIYAYYEVPSIESTEFETHTYAVIRPDGDVPLGGKLVDIIDVVVEVDTEGTQGVMIYPVYRLSSIMVGTDNRVKIVTDF